MTNPIAAMLGMVTGSNSPSYRAKRCKCGQLAGHEGRCTGGRHAPLVIETPPRGARAQGRYVEGKGRRWARPAQTAGVPQSMRYSPRRSPKAAQVPGAREGMARIRSRSRA